MKTNFENSIKDSLDQFELPYDASAWTALSKKLDLVQPVSSPKSNLLSGSGKWFLAAGIATIAASAIIFTLNETTKEPIEKASTEKISKIKEQSDNDTAPTSSEKIIESTNSNQSEKIGAESVKSDNLRSTKKVETNLTQDPINDGSSLKTQKTDGSNSNQKGEQSGNPSNSKSPNTVSIIAPIINSVCAGELVVIKNENSVDLAVVGPIKDYVLRKNSSTKIEFLDAGKYEVSHANQTISSFYVNASPKVDFIFDDQNQFEDGLPTTKVQTFTDGNSYVWNCEGVSKNGRASTFHFFKKGGHDVTLKVTSEKGCESEITKSIDISSDYNLLAPTAFEPNHSDARRNRFIPNALLVRDTPFTMIILDPKTGATLFTTSNAQDGWDGTDKNTGELVDESTYVWKVFLKKPTAGEKSEYSGTVVRK